MKLKNPKRLLALVIPAFLILFSGGIITSMAAAGKIDLSSVPVVGKVFTGKSQAESLAAGQTGTLANLSVTPKEQYVSPIGISVSDDNYIYVADQTGMAVYKVSIAGKNIAATYSAGQQVNGVYLNGGTVYVLEGGLDGKLTVLNSSMQAAKKISVGHTPCDMAITGTTAYVANRFTNNVSVVNLTSGTVTKEIAVKREPHSLSLSGTKLFVASHLPDDAANGTQVAAKVCVIDTAANQVVKEIALTNGSGGVKDTALSPDGKTLYVSHVLARYGYPTTQLDRGWINTNAVTAIDVQSMTVTATVLLDDVELGAANPWGLAVSGDGSRLVVAISGTRELMVVDLGEMNNRIAAVKAGTGLVAETSRIADYLPFLDGAKVRVALPGNGPRALQIQDGKVYVGQYFSGDIAVMNLSDNAVSSITFKTQPAADPVRLGETLWADATACYQQWESCNSCHPDARVDGFNWDNLNDGLGNAKSAKSMLYSHRTPPVMVTGIRASAETAVRAGMKFIQFNVLPEEELTAIDEYLKSLLPEPSPHLNKDGTLTASAERGKALFESQGCVDCHPAPLYTDMKLHASKTLDPAKDGWENRPFDTPSLVEAWRSGPWLFNGKANTMEDVVRLNAPDLTDLQVTDLANYVMSIGAEGEKYGVEQVLFTDSNGNSLYNALSPGSKITKFTVRKQAKDAPDAKVTFELFDNTGKSLYKSEKNLGSMDDNTAVTVTLGSGVAVSPTLAKGSYYKISIADAVSSQPLATDLVVKY